MRTLTASDRASLIRLAASLPVGDENRRAILSSLQGVRVAEKRFQVSPKEKARADRSIEGSPFTIISRPQTDGSYMVAAVDPDTGLLVFEGAVEFADDKSGVADAVRRLNRNLDKNTGLSSKMTERSRHQHLASAPAKGENRRAILSSLSRKASDKPRLFTEHDWHAYSGAEEFRDGGQPVIAQVEGLDIAEAGEGMDIAVVIVDGNGASIEFYSGSRMDEGPIFSSREEAKDSDDALDFAEDLVYKLESGRLPRGFRQIN